MSNKEVAEAPERIVVSYDPGAGIGVHPSAELTRSPAFDSVEYARVKQPSATTLQTAEETATRIWAAALRRVAEQFNLSELPLMQGDGNAIRKLAATILPYVGDGLLGPTCAHCNARRILEGESTWGVCALCWNEQLHAQATALNQLERETVERCAVICDAIANDHGGPYIDSGSVADECGTAIRATVRDDQEGGTL